MHKLLLFSSLPVILILLLLFAMIGGGSGPGFALPIVASEEKAEEYAVAASQFGVPWDVVILSDALLAMEQGASDIEDVNPMETTLQFLTLVVEVEILTESTDENGNTIRQWVLYRREKYNGKDEILEYLGLSDGELDPSLTPDELSTLAKEVADEELKESVPEEDLDEWRTKTHFSANTDLPTCIKQYVSLSEGDTDRVMELYYAQYIEQTHLSPEGRERLRQIRAQYGVYQYLEGEPLDLGGITFRDGSREVVYYNQLDSRWASEAYGRTGTIGQAGCGPTAMAIVISSMTGQTVDPLYMSRWSVENGYRCEGSGSYRTLIPDAAIAFGLEVSSCSVEQSQQVADSLAQGALVVAIMGPGDFTSSGHFIVLRGITEEGEVLVADPASVRRSGELWDLSLVLGQVSKTATATGPLWIIEEGDGG